MNAVPLDQLTYETFAGMLKTKWRVHSSPGNAFELELAAVTPRRLTPADPAGGSAYEQFTLVLLGPLDRLLPQRIYEFEVESLGRFELFIVPVRRDANGTSYEATFNRKVVAP